MISGRSLLLLLVLTLIAAGWTVLAYAGSWPTGTSSRAQARAETALRGFDYLPEILAMPSRSLQIGVLNMQFYREHHPDHVGRELSPAEQRLFCEFTLDQNQYVSFDQTVGTVLDCWRDTGSIPADGLGLLSWQTGGPIWNKRSEAILTSGEELDVSEYLRLFPSAFCVINPATGRYIDNFQQVEWAPLGICITEVEEIPDSYYVTDASGNRVLPEGFSIVRVKLYGEDEGEVIYDHIVASYEVRDVADDRGGIPTPVIK